MEKEQKKAAVNGEKETYMEHDDDYVGAIMDKRKESGAYEDDLVTLKSTPVNEAKEVESVEQAAENRYPNWKNSDFDKGGKIGFITGYNYRATHPIENNLKGKQPHEIIQGYPTFEENQIAQKHFLLGLEYREANPIDNKEGVKSATEQDAKDYTDLWMHDINDNRNRYEMMAGFANEYHAQFTPIEQGKRMVSVEEVKEMFNAWSDCYADKDNGLPIPAMTWDAVFQIIQWVTNQK